MVSDRTPAPVPGHRRGHCDDGTAPGHRHERGHRTLDFLPRLKAGDSGTTYRWFEACAPSRVAPRPSCFDADSPVREDSR